jgi:hypothetical protein
MNVTLRWLALALVAGATGCDAAATDPGAADPGRVEVHVGGGIAGADYAYRVERGAVTGVTCRSLCTFAAGDTLLVLTPAQRGALAEAVERSGLPAWSGPTDFGTQCCDQFEYRVSWSANGRQRTFTGSDGALPAPLRELVRVLQLMQRGIPPLVLSQARGLAGFTADALTLSDARADGGLLVVDASWSGGCVRHDVDAVVWTGWMESHPVQVGVSLAHDAHGDACKALVQRQLRFDLEPLRRAYAEAYGSGPGTLVMRLGVASGGPIRSVPYSF